MKKHASVLLIAAAVLTAVFVAGCTSQTASPTPSPSAAPSTATGTAPSAATGTVRTTTPSVGAIAPTALPNSTDLSSFFTSYMPSQGYTVIIPFDKSVNKTTGNDQYSGTITDHKAVYEAAIQLAKSSTDTTNVFNSATSMLQQQGYIPLRTNSTTWIGYNSNANNYLAYVSQDTTDNFVVVLVPPSGSS